MPRPKSFDPDAVLAKAMGVFWEKGYDAASISDLTAAMGINRFSLYDTFGDKHALYLKALDFYDQRVVGPIIERINEIDSIAGLECFFDALIGHGKGGRCATKPCCMMQKTAVSMAGVDDDAKERVECVRGRLHGAFRAVLGRIRDRGELREGLNLDDAAWMIMITQTGLLSYSSSPIPESDARAAVGLIVSQLKP